MDKIVLQNIINKKEKRLNNIVLENVGIAAFVAGLTGLILGEFYSRVLNNLALHILNVFLYGTIGFIIGYLQGKSKKMDLKVEIMLLKDLDKRTK